MKPQINTYHQVLKHGLLEFPSFSSMIFPAINGDFPLACWLTPEVLTHGPLINIDEYSISIPFIFINLLISQANHIHGIQQTIANFCDFPIHYLNRDIPNIYGEYPMDSYI